jgi:hypothetical protein
MGEGCMTEEKKEHVFVIDTLACLLEHLAKHEDAELGNREILHNLIAKEIQHRAALILKT